MAKGFELAISTLVVMILGVLIIGGGLLIVAKLTKSSTDAAGTLTANQRNHLKELMSTGQLVAVYPLSQTIPAGTSGTVGVGVENRLGTDATFEVFVKDAQGNDASWARVLPTLDVANNKQAEAVIVLSPPKTLAQGTYTFLVNVTVADATYDAVRVFTVRVE
jgi:hypothetical protein